MAGTQMVSERQLRSEVPKMTFADTLTAVRADLLALCEDALAEIDAVTARHVREVGVELAELGIDPERVEQEIADMLRKRKPARARFERRRAALAAGVPPFMLDSEPPQV